MQSFLVKWGLVSRFKRFSIKSITASCFIAVNMHESVKILEVKFELHGICPTCRRFSSRYNKSCHSYTLCVVPAILTQKSPSKFLDNVSVA